jgi:hypothetical protein
MQADCPVFAPYFPAKHAAQAFVADPVADKYKPDAQDTHEGDPGDTWYWPDGQLTHALVVDPVEVK